MMDVDCRKVAFLLLISIDMVLGGEPTCNDLLSQYLAAGKNCSADGGKLPYISLTVDCSGDSLVWNYTQQARNAGLENIIEVLVEYNISNMTTGEVVTEGVIYSDWQSLKSSPGRKLDLALASLEIDSNLTYTFGACMAIQGYQCWVINEHKVTCNEPDPIPEESPSPTLINSNPTFVSRFLSMSISASPSPVMDLPYASTELKKPITSPPTEGSPSNENNQTIIMIVAITFPVVIVMFVFGVLMLVCLIMAAHGHRPLGAKWHFKEISQFMKEKDTENYYYNSTKVQVQFGKLSTAESISTIFETVDLSLLKGIPPVNHEPSIEETKETVTAHWNDNTKQAWHEEKSTIDIAPQITTVDTTDSRGSQSSRKRNPSEVSVEGYLKITQELNVEDNVFTENTSDLDRSINMCNEDGYIQDFETNVEKNNSDAEITVSRSGSLNNEDCSSMGMTTDDGYLCTSDSSVTNDELMNESSKSSSSTLNNDVPSSLYIPVDDGYLQSSDDYVAKDELSSSSTLNNDSLYIPADDGYLHSSDNVVTENSPSTLNNCDTLPIYTPVDDGYLHLSEDYVAKDKLSSKSSSSTLNNDSLYIPVDDGYLHSSDTYVNQVDESTNEIRLTVAANSSDYLPSSPAPSLHSRSVHDLSTQYSYTNGYLPPDVQGTTTTMYSSNTDVKLSPEQCCKQKHNESMHPSPFIANSDPYISTIESTSDPYDVRYTAHQPIPKTLFLPVHSLTVHDSETPLVTSPRTMQDYLHDDGYSTSDAYTPDDRESGHFPRLQSSTTRINYLKFNPPVNSSSTTYDRNCNNITAKSVVTADDGYIQA